MKVQSQIDRIDRELDIQLRRMSQMQRELDELKTKVRMLSER